MLRKLADQKLSILMVTHDLEFAASYADRCGLLFDGQLISEDEPHGFFSGNRFYTTAAGLIAGDRIEKVITCGEVIAACPVSYTHLGSVMVNPSKDERMLVTP